MIDPAGFELQGVLKRYQALRPLRIEQLAVRRGDALAIAGVDAAGAEMFVNLVTGAALPDEGDVRVAGRSTRDIATDTDWLASLDRFGIVTARAVLLENMSVAANLALPFTLAIDPLAPDMRDRVETLAEEVGLPSGRLDAPAGSLGPAERLRVHLARALGPGPELLLLEHPTAALERDASRAFGETLGGIVSRRQLGWLALTEDEHFVRAAGARHMRLNGATGALSGGSLWRRWLS